MTNERATMEALGDRIAMSAAHLDAAMSRLLADLREFDAGGGWHQAGAASCAHWLSWRVGWTLPTAREHVRVARALGGLPSIDAALGAGRLSFSKVRALTRVATPATEQALLTDAFETTAAQLEIVCRKLRMVHRLADAASVESIGVRRTVVRRELDDGMVRIEAVLTADEAAVVWAAIDREAREARSPDGAPRFSRADGLVAMSERTLRGDAPDRAPTEIVLTIARDALQGEEPGLGCFTDGTCVSAETSRRLACDAGIVTLVEDAAGQTLSVGRKTRSIPAAIKRALLYRDQHCRFPGCTNRQFLNGHHVWHWINGGHTRLDNLCSLCTRHHTYVHEHGFRVELTDGNLVFRDPQGRQVHDDPRVTERTAPGDTHQAWRTLTAGNAALAIDAGTGLCAWDGRPPQYDLIVNDLWRLEQRAV